MMKNKVLLFVFALFLTVSLVACAAPTPTPAPAPAPTPAPAPAPAPTPAPEVEVINWTMQTFASTAAPFYKLDEIVVDKINAASGGRLVINLFSGGAIVPAQEELEALRTGILDMAHTCAAYNLALNPAFANFEAMVGGMSSVQRVFWFKVGGGMELLAEGMSPFGVTVLSTAAAVPEDWGYTTFPLKTLDDVKKLKMRTSGDGGEILARMGAATVNLPGGELYESMQRGVINAFEYAGAGDAWEMGFHEVMDYLYVSLSRAPSDFNFFGARTESFNALPDDLKVIVKGMAESEALGYYVYSVPQNAVALDKIIDYGVQVEKLPKEIEDELLRVAAEFYDEKMAEEDDYYRRVMTSQREFKRLLELQGIY